MKSNKLIMVLAIAAIVAGKSIYLKGANPNQGIAIAGQQQPEIYPSKTYIALETNSPEIAELDQNILYILSRRTKNRWTVVDILVGEKVQNLYSHVARRRDFEALSQQVKVVPSSEEALIQAIQRLKDEVEQNKQQSIFGFIVTKGTANPSTLTAIREICRRLGQISSTKVHIAIIGLSAENRLPMSTAVAPLSRNVQFAGTNQQEWQQLIKF